MDKTTKIRVQSHFINICLLDCQSLDLLLKKYNLHLVVDEPSSLCFPFDPACIGDLDRRLKNDSLFVEFAPVVVTVVTTAPVAARVLVTAPSFVLLLRLPSWFLLPADPLVSLCCCGLLLLVVVFFFPMILFESNVSSLLY